MHISFVMEDYSTIWLLHTWMILNQMWSSQQAVFFFFFFFFWGGGGGGQSKALLRSINIRPMCSCRSSAALQSSIIFKRTCWVLIFFPEGSQEWRHYFFKILLIKLVMVNLVITSYHLNKTCSLVFPKFNNNSFNNLSMPALKLIHVSKRAFSGFKWGWQ